jgi:hypothetical protein
MTVFIQLLLAVVITTLTLLIAIIAVQVFHLLHDFRLTLKKINHILDNTRVLSDAVARPVTAVNQFFTEVRDMVGKTEDEIIDQTRDKVLPGSKLRFFRRFFRRGGLPLHPQ